MSVTLRRAGVAALALIAASAAALAAPGAGDPRPRPHVVRVEHRPATDDPSLGPARAPVTAELFFVPGHRESNVAYRRVRELQARHPRRLRVVFRVITRQAQVIVPLAAIEAHAQGRFDEFMQEVVTAKSGTIKRDELPGVAAAAGMDPVRLERALERATDPELYPPAMRASERRQRRLGQNVPELLLNGRRVAETLAHLDVDDLERYYDAAYADAVALLDDGVPIEHLVAATERRHAPPYAVTSYRAGDLDDAEGVDLPGGAPPLLARPLALDALPADGPADAAVQAVLLCNLRRRSCKLQLDIARRLRELYPDELRVTWHPWSDGKGDGDEHAPRLHAAAVCAEAQGAGWRWIAETAHQVLRSGPGADPAPLVDQVAALTEVDRAALDACLVATEDAAVTRRVQRAIGAGVSHGPAWVIGGRVFLGGFTDQRAASPVIEAELAPGLLERLVPSW